MPHERSRFLSDKIKSSLKHSPIVGVVGQRQVGKTTLIETFVTPETYFSLDQPTHRNTALNHPEHFIDRDTLTAIDECQMAPELFPALKERIRTYKKPGQFLLSGSIRFTSRKVIRESLTGRIVTHELLPMSMAELNKLSSLSIFDLITAPIHKIEKQINPFAMKLKFEQINEYLLCGGLPGICFYRDRAVRDERFGAHIDTLLQRDIQLVYETSLPQEKLWKLLRTLARIQGRPISSTELSRETRISRPTLEYLLPAFEALFLIRRIGSIGDRKKDRFYLEDQGMATFLYPLRDPELDLTRFAWSQLFAQTKLKYGAQATFESFETRSGVSVPIVIDINGEKTGFVPIAMESPNSNAQNAAESFLRHSPKGQVVILTTGRTITSLSKNIRVLPIGAVL
jgi:uncharacterized protein